MTSLKTLLKPPSASFVICKHDFAPETSVAICCNSAMLSFLYLSWNLAGLRLDLTRQFQIRKLRRIEISLCSILNIMNEILSKQLLKRTNTVATIRHWQRGSMAVEDCNCIGFYNKLFRALLADRLDSFLRINPIESGTRKLGQHDIRRPLSLPRFSSRALKVRA